MVQFMTVHIGQLALETIPIEASHVERARTADERLNFICPRTVPHGVDRLAERVDIDFHSAFIETMHLSNASPIGLPIYGDAGDINFSCDIARTDSPGILTSRRRFSCRNRASAGIEPASPGMSVRRDTAREIESRAPPGCTSPASRRHRPGAFPSYLPARLSSRGGFNPRPLSTPIIYTAAVYMARDNRISGCVSTISAQSPYRIPNGEKEKAVRRASRPADRHAISGLPSPVSIRTCR